MYKRSKYITKNVRKKIIYIGIASFIAFILVTISLYTIAKRQKNNAIHDFMTNKSEALDKKIDSELHNYFHINLEQYSRPSKYSLFFELDENNLSFFHQIRISMTDSIRFLENVSDLTLYRSSDNAIVSTRYSGYHLDNIPHFSEISSLINGKLPEAQFHVIDQNDKTGINKIAYLYPLYNPNIQEENELNYLGFASLTIKNPELFFQSKVKDFNSAGTFLVMSKSRILFAEGADALADSKIFEMINKQKDSSIISKKVQSINYTYYFVTSTTSNLTYLYYEPTLNMFQYIFSSHYYVFIYLLLITVLLLISFFTIVQMIQGQYVTLKENKAVETYKNQLKKSNRPKNIIIKEHFLSLAGKHKYYSLIIFEPDPTYINTYLTNSKQIETFKESFIKEFDNIFSKFKLTNTLKFQLDGPIIYIINHKEDNDIDNLVEQFSGKVDIFIQTHTECKYNVFYTKPYISKELAVNTCPQLLDNMKYSYIHNYPNVFVLDQLEEMEKNSKLIDNYVIETIQGYLKELDPNSFKNYLNDTLHSIRTKGYSYNQAMDFFYMALCTLKNFIIERSVESKFKDTTFIEEMKDFRNIEECIDFMVNSLQFYKENMQKNHTTTNKRYIDGILKSIDSNIEDVTLSSVAEEFHITSAHLSRIFKENMGVNFSEYVTEKKLLRATEILKEDPTINIVDIANQLGYNTPSYFSAKFKERYGVTPSKYKKNLIENI